MPGSKYGSGRISDYLFFLYNFCEQRTIWPASLVVSMPDYEPRGQRLILRLGPIFQYVIFFFHFSGKAEFFHISKVSNKTI